MSYSLRLLWPLKSIVTSRFHNGYVLAADYSQIELRIAAQLAGCEVMLDIFEKGKLDIHRFTAADNLEKPYEEVTDKERQEAGKTPNFSIIYDCSPPKLVEIYQRAGVVMSLRRAAQIIRRWYHKYPGFREWQAETKAFVATKGYVECPTGYRENISANYASKDGRKGFKQAINAPIQHGASAICNAGFCELVELACTRKFYGKVYVMGQVYDSIVADVRGTVAEAFQARATKLLTNRHLLSHLGWTLEVPIPVEWKRKRHLN